MKKSAFIFIVFFCVIHHALAQSARADSLLNVIIASKVDSLRIQAAFDLSSTYNTYPVDTALYFSQAILRIALEQKNKTLQAIGYSDIGFILGTWLGDKTKGLEFALKSLEIAEQINNNNLLVKVYLTNSGFYDTYDSKGLDLALKGLELAKASGYYRGEYRAYNILADKYLRRAQPDSALIYQQRAYELAIRFDIPLATFNFENLSRIHLLLGNKDLAFVFAKMALSSGGKTGSPHFAFRAMAQYYKSTGNIDSCLYYNKKIYETVKNKTWVANVALEIYGIYKEAQNRDSALKYLEVAKAANDSANNIQEINKLQNLRFQEDIRQKQLAAEKEHAKTERRNNLQYTAIAISLIIFVVLFLALSRSIIVKEKFIKFCGVLGLLAVFEFINLLIHPYLDRLTDHSPVLMLGILICIGALLVPLHHRLEKWITKRMVEKNNQIRLAAAKKTIAKLESASTTITTAAGEQTVKLDDE